MASLVLALLEEHDNAQQVKACLEAYGHEIYVVDTYTNALALLGTKKIDLIISDVHLENGGTVFDFLRLVKKGQWTCQIPFILFSSRPTPMAKYLAEGIRITARYLGAVKYIEMETFDAVLFQEQINSLLFEEKQTEATEKESALATKIGE
jgi:CheY-like chemotaxis protein